MKTHDKLIEELSALRFDVANYELNLRDFAEAVMCEFEGPEGLAKEVALLYRTPRTPASTRATILKMLLAMFLQVSGEKTSGKAVPADYQKVFERMMSQMPANGDADV